MGARQAREEVFKANEIWLLQTTLQRLKSFLCLTKFHNLNTYTELNYAACHSDIS
jgi:hypothetical protein